MCLISLSMHAKFEGNLITRLHFMAVFCKCVKRRKENKIKKMSDFLKAYISGMADMIYFKSGMCSLPICQQSPLLWLEIS